MRARRFLILLLVGAVGVWSILGSGSSPRRSSPVTYTTKHKTFQIKSTPSGAQIFIDGKRKGVTPASVRVNYQFASRGYHPDEKRDWELKLTKQGFETYSTTFKLSNGPPKHVRLTQKYAENVSVTGAASALRRITTGGPHETILDVSNNSRWLLIEASDAGEGATDAKILQKLSVSGGGRVMLTPKNSKNYDAVWSADNKSIIFISDRLGTSTLVQSLGVSGETGVRFITQPSLGKASDPSVNVRSGDIAFSVASNNPCGGTISIIGNDGSNLRMFGEGRQPAWSPDGRVLIFVRKAGDKYRIFSMDAETGSSLTELSSTNANDYQPVWSPDGNFMAFVSDRLGGRRHLFFMTRNGQGVTQLTNGFFDVGAVAWAKNGTIYFSANAGGNWDIWSLRPNVR